jgi:copper(I)-binding protein
LKALTALCAGVVATVALAGCGSNDDGSTSATATETTATTTSETTTTAEATPVEVKIVVRDGAPQGGIVRQTVSQGDDVVLVVTSDVADEIHLHGYDKSKDVAAGGMIRLPFTATLPGRFEVELEQRGVQIADLTVNP